MSKILVIAVLLSPVALSFSILGDNDSSEGLTRNTTDELELVPDIHGRFYSINITQRRIEYSETKKIDYKIFYYVITRKYPDEGKLLIVGNETSLRESGFNPEHPTRILVHGWLGSRESKLNMLVGGAYLRRGEYNLIVIDWSDAANTYDYYSARNSIGKFGAKIAEMVDFLNSHARTPPGKIYLIAHSLGAHLVSAAARRVKSGRIGVIVALDAALPLFSERYKDRLSASDAEYLLSIHTNGGTFGIHEPLGHGAFYPNWGRGQPGCGIDVGGCSHARCVNYFAESLMDVKNGFVSHKCKSFREILSKRCFTKIDEAFLGGDPINTSFKGVYYLKTNSKQPYGIGLTHY